MNELKLFLKALEEVFEDKGVIFIDRLTITPQKPIAAYKEYKLEIYSVCNKQKELIGTVQMIDKVVTETQDLELKKRITKQAIVIILQNYNLQF